MDLQPSPQPQAPAAGAMPGQPPTAGSSPATQPTANRGQQAAGLAMLSVGVKVLEKAFSQLGVGTEPGRDVLDALKRLSKHVPTGQVPSGVENNAMQGIMDQNRQNSSLMALMRARGAGGQPQAAAAPPPQMAA